MLKLSKALLLLISTLSIVNSQLVNSNTGTGAGVGGAGTGATTGATTGVGAGAGATTGVQNTVGACTKVTSNLCKDFPSLHAKVGQAEFDALVQSKYDTLKSSFKGTVGTTCATYDNAFASNVRYLKSYACALVLKDQGCTGNSVICTKTCDIINTSLSNVGCINAQAQTSFMTNCNSIAVNLSTCVDSTNSEMDTCGLEDSAAKAAFCSTQQNTPCCRDSTAAVAPAATTTASTAATSSTASSETKSTTKTTKKKSGSFFTSKLFLISMGILAAVIGILGFFYYMGAKDEKEERMRNMENGVSNNGDTYQNNNYGGTQTVEVNKNQNLEVNNNYNAVSPYDEKPSYSIPATNSADPFADSNQVDPISPYNTTYNSGLNDNSAYNAPYNTSGYNDYSPSNDYGLSNDYKSYNDLQNAVSYQNPQMVAAPAQNPFDAPEAVIPENAAESQLNKSMQEISKNFAADDMPTPSVVKMTSIETPQQGNTNSDDKTEKNENIDDILKPSMVIMTNIETPVPTNTVPTDKDISIGDDVLKPSMVTLTEIQTPQETSFNNDANKEKEANDEEPKKAVVNMIDLKTPDSNEALNAGNLLTPSIMITNTEGETTQANTADDGVQEEYSEMPEPRPFRCIHAYEPQIDDELRLDIDNDIDVLYEYDDGWCWAINKTSGEQGACPMLCLISVQEEVAGDREWEKEMEVMKVPGRRDSMLSNSFDTSRLSFTKK